MRRHHFITPGFLALSLVVLAELAPQAAAAAEEAHTSAVAPGMARVWIGGRSSHQDRPHSGAVGRKSPKMAREPQALISTSLATAAPDKRRTERLSLRAAIFWIGVISFAAWAAIIALALALF